jgi:hypothetical protein
MPNPRVRRKKPVVEIDEEDFAILEPILIAARDAVHRSKWRLGDPIENLTGFIALVVIATITRQMKEAGIIKDEPTDGTDDCGFF